MTLATRLLAASEEGYDTAVEDDRLAALSGAFADGSWAVEDVEVVVRWKSSRVMGYFRGNDPDEIERRVERALATSSVTRKLQQLTELDGVAVRVASAMLMFMDPDRFTVLDWRAWDVLYDLGYLSDPFPSDPDVESYLLFLGASRAIANEYDVSLRTLDRVLWSLGGTG